MKMTYKSNKIEFIYIFEGPAKLTPRFGKSWIIEINEKKHEDFLHPKHTIICDRLMLEPGIITKKKEEIDVNNGQHILELVRIYHEKEDPSEFLYRCRIAKVFPIFTWFKDKIDEINMIKPALDEDYTDFYEEEFNKIIKRIEENKKLYPIHIEIIENILHEIDNYFSDEPYMTFMAFCDPKTPGEE